MCVGALVNARVATVVYGAADPKWGAVRSLLDVVEAARSTTASRSCAGVLEDECRELLVDFFKSAPRSREVE